MSQYRGVYRGVYGALFDDPGFLALSSTARHVLLHAEGAHVPA